MNRGFPDQLELDVFAALLDDIESFGVIHTDLVRNGGYTDDLSVDDVISVLKRMLTHNWVRISNPRAPSKSYWRRARSAYLEWLRDSSGELRVPREDVYFMDFGPWFALTPEGRRHSENRQGMIRKDRLDP